MARKTPHEIPAGQWVGSCALAPFYVAEAERPQRVAIALWLELPADQLIGQKLAGGDTDPAQMLADSLRECLRRPLTGKRRQPAALRVEREEFAAALREVVGDSIVVRVGPVPELDAAFESLFAHMDAAPSDAARESLSYLASGRVKPESVEKLFAAAEHFRLLKPWEKLGGRDLLRVDIPQLELHAACVQILGLHGSDRGFALFPSLAHYERFQDLTESLRGDEDRLPRIGTPMRMFTLERGADLPDSMRKEVAVHGWKAKDPDSYPLVVHCDEDSVPRPLVDADTQIMASAAMAIGTFALQASGTAPLSVSYENPDGITVRLTSPYESYEEFEPERSRRAKRRKSQGANPNLKGKHWSDLSKALAKRGRTLPWSIGVLTAAGTHPSTRVMPSQWLPLLLGEGSFRDENEARALMGSIMICYNEVVAGLDEGMILIPPAKYEPVIAWCNGYRQGLLLDDAWQSNRTAMRILEPVFGSGAALDDEDALVEAALEAHLHFREMRMTEVAASRGGQRAGAARSGSASAPRIVPVSAGRKPGRNEPCPCGSGRKYKNCCMGVEN